MYLKMTFKSLIIKIKYTKSSYFYILVIIMCITIVILHNAKPKSYISKVTVIPQPRPLYQSLVWQLNLPNITLTSTPSTTLAKEYNNLKINTLPKITFKYKFTANTTENKKHNVIKAKSNETEYQRIEFDRHRVSTRVWSKGDSRCKTFRIYFATPHSLPICGISSFPGSGNTWLRRLIEAATGIFTGSQYDDGSIYLNGYFGELDFWDKGTTIVQKTHGASQATIESLNSRGIFIIRNPYKAILSLHNFMFGGHHMFAPIVNFRRKDWPAFVHLQIKHWLQSVINWVSFGKEVLVIHYENLVRNPIREIRKVLKFLWVKVDEERLSCIQNNNFREFQRTDEYFPESLIIFNNKTTDKMDRAIRYTVFLLEKYGHETPPLQHYEFYNNTFNKLNMVPCKEKETKIECDARVDDLNRNSRIFVNKFQEKAYKFLTQKVNYVSENPAQKHPEEIWNISANSTF